MSAGSVIDRIKSGERARLIPVVADMSREERAVAPLLAIFSVVPALANSMLEEVGAPTNPRAKVRSFSQVVFKDAPDKKRWRPDGLMVVDSGRKVWSTLVEAKVGNAELTAEQIEAYLDLARDLGVDAVITISNQFATVPTHHPVQVAKQKLRSVELYHFSWVALLTKATLLSNAKAVEDPEQAFLLRELIRFLSHGSSGVCDFTRVGPEWKEVVGKIQTGTPLAKGAKEATAVAADWQQLTRFLSLELSAAIGKAVSVRLSRAQSKDPTKRLEDDAASLATSNTLRAEFDIPNAASPVSFEADFMRRTIRFSAALNTPEDRVRPTAALTWALRQLPKLAESTDTLIRLRWLGRAPDSVATLADANREPATVIPDGKKELPLGFELQRVVDLAGRFKGAATFVEDARRELPRFYKEVVQNLTRWVPKAPKLKDEPSPAAAGREELAMEIEVIKEQSEARDVPEPERTRE